MSSSRVRATLVVWRAMACALVLALSHAAMASPPDLGPAQPGAYQAALVTYGPGDIYWQRFGHNALWLREPALGLDDTFNFGFFDFEQESFLLRFVQGRMLYFAARLPAQREFAHYQEEGRSIRVQVLNLDADTYRTLRNHLLHHVEPDQREYLYDYYLDNCSTRVRDALDLALGGALRTQFDQQPALQSFRDHTRRSSASDLAYQLGLQAALGMPVDRPVSRWDEMFLPAVLADGLGEVHRLGAAGLEPLVREDLPLLGSNAEPVPDTPPALWPRYGLVAIALLLLGVLAQRHAPPAAVQGLVGGWLLITGSLGWLLLLVWGFTDHAAAHPNLNLLLFSPFAVLGLWPGLRRLAALVLVVGAGLAVAQQFTLELQYQVDVLAGVGLVNLGVAAWLWRQ